MDPIKDNKKPNTIPSNASDQAKLIVDMSAEGVEIIGAGSAGDGVESADESSDQVSGATGDITITPDITK